MDQTKHKIAPVRDTVGRPTATEVGSTRGREAGLENDIERARYETAASINELKRRLAPAHLKEQARQATVGKAEEMARNTGNRVKSWGSSMMDSVRNNPIPVAMVGSGLAWMITSRMRHGRDEEYDYEDYTDEYYSSPAIEKQYVGERTKHPDLHYGYEEDFGDVTATEANIEGIAGTQASMPAGEFYSSEAGTGEESAKRTEQLRQKADEIRGRVRERSSQVRSQLRERASHLSHTAREGRERVRHSGRKAKEGFFHQVEENPLAVTGIAMAVGAVMGLALPESQQERDRMGSLRDKVVDKVRQAGRDTFEKVERVAEEATQAAKTEAERQDLIGKDTADKIEDKAREAKYMAKDKIPGRDKPFGSL